MLLPRLDQNNGKFLAIFFAIFSLVPKWSWDALLSSYHNNPTISVSTSVHTQNQAQELDATDIPSASQQDDNIQLVDTLDLPEKQVWQAQTTMYHYLYMYFYLIIAIGIDIPQKVSASCQNLPKGN